MGNAEACLRQFCEKNQIPLVTTMMGIGVMPMDSPYYLGMIGSHGRTSANKAMSEADLVILCGARVGDRAVAAPESLAEKAKIIHIDIDPAEIGKNYDGPHSDCGRHPFGALGLGGKGGEHCVAGMD